MNPREEAEILKLHQPSNDILITIISGLILLIILQLPHYSLLRVLIIGLNIFIFLGYSILSLFSVDFQRRGILSRVIYSFIVSMGTLIIFSFLPLAKGDVLRLCAIITIFAAFVGYLRRRRRVKESLRGVTGEAVEPIITPAKVAEIAIKKRREIEAHEVKEPSITEYMEPGGGFNYRFYSDILLILVVTIITLAPWFYEILGVFYILFIPGYLLTIILTPSRESINIFERLFLSFAFSIIISSIVGFFGLGVNPSNYTFIKILAFISLVLIVPSSIRRALTEDEKRFYWDPRKSLEMIKGIRSLKRSRGISILMICLLILLTGATGYLALNHPPMERFTEFYILNSEGKAYDYPTNLTIGESGEVIIGVVNHEYQEMNYKLVVKLENDTIEEETIKLENGGKWEKRIEFTPRGSGKGQKLEFLLYRLPDEKNIYRSLHLFVDVYGRG